MLYLLSIKRLVILQMEYIQYILERRNNMTKQKLLELCQKLRKREITKTEILKLKELNDKEIDIVLNGINKDVLIKLLSNENFRTLPPVEKDQIINIINSCDDQYGKAEHIVNVATNVNAISSNLVVELAITISRAKGLNQSYISSLVACNFNSIVSGKVVSLVKILSECLNEEQLKIAYYAATNPHIIASGNAPQIVRLISNAKNKQEALDMYYKALNTTLSINPLDALSEGKISAIDFWQVFAEDGEEAIYLLDDLKETEELLPQTIITAKNAIPRKSK